MAEATIEQTQSSPRAGIAEQPLMQVKNLAVSFDNGSGPRIQAVDGVRMTVYPRQTLAVVGESGCGKSVTSMSSMQLVPRPPGRFDRGEILYRKENDEVVNLLELSESEMRKIRGNEIAMIFQEPMTSLNPVYTVGDQIIEAITLHQNVNSKEAMKIAIDAMDAVGIPDPQGRIKAYPHQFSGGMRQRVMIAMALACQPRLLLADEPTTALDVTIQAQILELLKTLKEKRNMAVMLITHDLGVVAENADIVCVMYAGRVVEFANVYDLYANPMHPYTRGLLASIPTVHSKLHRLTTITEVVDDPEQFKKLPGADQGITPWWPWNDAPADLCARDEPAGDYVLRKVAKDHWVGVWRTEAVKNDDTSPPDLSFRISDLPKD
ncbi:MAG: ABC transporter ATP-binding protein [Phycisphaerales bacterium]|nr:ABC transporter ATP-binding protein [Phycisphaerales bacterium]